MELRFSMHLSMVCPRMGGSGNPGEFRKAHMGWDFDIRSDPQGGEFDLTTILKSREDLGMSDEWCAMLENTQNSSEQVSRVKECQRWLNER